MNSVKQELKQNHNSQYTSYGAESLRKTVPFQSNSSVGMIVGQKLKTLEKSSFTKQCPKANLSL